MKYVLLTLAFVLVSISGASVQSGGGQESTVVTAPVSETSYLVAHQAADSRFITSIERTGPCKLLGPPLTTVIRVPWEIYPRESVEKHEEGTARVQLIFDPDWCVRKATITQSSGYWRLDNVSLRFAMTIKFTPKKTFFTADGEPTITIPVAWGASQRKR
jgi:TonB family protein